MWVNFKLFGIMGLMLLFAVVQGVLLYPYIKEE
jgi:intracellular septation protein A